MSEFVAKMRQNPISAGASLEIMLRSLQRYPRPSSFI